MNSGFVQSSEVSQALDFVYIENPHIINYMIEHAKNTFNKMDLYNTYLPAMKWLRNDEINRPRGRLSSKVQPRSPSPPLDDDVSAHGAHMQIARDELFLPPERKNPGKEMVTPLCTGWPVYGDTLHTAQRLPRAAKFIDALPACLIAGLDSLRSQRTSLAGHRSPDQKPRPLRAERPKEIHKSMTPRNGTSDVSSEDVDWTRSKEQRGRQEGSSQKFDPVSFSQIPSHYDLRRRF